MLEVPDTVGPTAKKAQEQLDPVRDLIDSGPRLRKLLALNLDKIKALDPLPKERRRTSSLKPRLISKYGVRCALCLKDGSVEAAHIIPLEIGASTQEANLILLCRSCHKKYDSGYFSIWEMQRLACEWREQKRIRPIQLKTNLTQASAWAITKPPKSVANLLKDVLRLQRERKYMKATRLIDQALPKYHPSSMASICLKIKRAEITRRRAARGVIGEALDTLRAIDVGRVRKEYRSLYYYELCYAHRLQGNHGEAATAIRKSAASSLDFHPTETPGIDYVAAEAIATVCEVSALEKLTRQQGLRFERGLRKLEGIARQHGDYWGGRWALNCAAHIIQVRIKAGDAAGSWAALSRLRQLFFKTDIATGWDAGGHQSLSLLEGLVHVLFPNDVSHTRRGVELLARSFVSRIGYRQRPEGIRDVGFALARGMRSLKDPKLKAIAESIDDCMRSTVDGTSVLWPWKAPKD